jgi:hypothetical protein
MSGRVGPSIVTDGLVFYVDAANPKSYISGSTTTDNLVGNGNGSLINGTDFSTDNQGTWVFDGTDSYINFDEFPELKLTTEFTIDVWVKANIELPDDGFGQIISKPTSNSNTPFFLYTLRQSWPGAGSYWQFLINGVNMKFIGSVSTTPSSVDEWVNIICVFNGNTQIMEIFINGISKESLNTGWSSILDETSDVYIGASKVLGTPAQFFGGHISNVQVYNRALLADEVLQNYNALKGRFGL